MQGLKGAEDDVRVKEVVSQSGRHSWHSDLGDGVPQNRKNTIRYLQHKK